jgi:hypothetical protein
MFIWQMTPKQRSQDQKLRFWYVIAVIVIGVAIRYPVRFLAILASIAVGGVIAFFMNRSERQMITDIAGDAANKNFRGQRRK